MYIYIYILYTYTNTYTIIQNTYAYASTYKFEREASDSPEFQELQKLQVRPDPTLGWPQTIVFPLPPSALFRERMLPSPRRFQISLSF